MRIVKIGVAGVSVKVGDFAGNRARLAETVAAARDGGVHLLVAPELSISGYSLEDRVWWPDIARRSWNSLAKLAEHTSGIAVFVGLPIRMNSLMYNAAALLYDGEIRGLIMKKFLPTYSIFYEGRNWTPWVGGVTEYNGVPAGDLIFSLPFGKVTAEVCEDLWATDSPARDRVRAGAEIVANCSASPFTPRKHERRKRLVLGASGQLTCVYAFANILGLDNSRLVFDGGGIIAKPGRIVAESELLSFEPWTLTTAVVDLDEISRLRAENSTWRLESGKRVNPGDLKTVEIAGTFTASPVAEYAAQLPRDFFVPDHVPQGEETALYLDELFRAMVLGLRDYYEKVGAFKKILIALSGGRDSALCLLLAVYAARALGNPPTGDPAAEIVETVYLPNARYSSSGTETAARQLAAAVGVPFRVVSIGEEADIALKKAAELAGGDDKVTALAKQNLQARVRGNMMLNWANNAQGLLLVTSNLSEAAVGYTTTGGDNQGGYSPIANIPKTLVTRLLEHVAEREGLSALQHVLAIPPSAELADDQQDEADLMPYAVLDDLMYLFAQRRMALSDCWRIIVCRRPEHSAEQLREWTAKFGRLFAYNQWKREQLPVSLRVLDLDLDPKTGFRFPVTQSMEDELEELAQAVL